MAKGGKGGPTLVVQAKVKEVIKKNKMNTSSDVMAGLTKMINEEISKAVARAKANGRKTVRASDF